jgi:hypothetical protein
VSRRTGVLIEAAAAASATWDGHDGSLLGLASGGVGRIGPEGRLRWRVPIAVEKATWADPADGSWVVYTENEARGVQPWDARCVIDDGYGVVTQSSRLYGSGWTREVVATGGGILRVLGNDSGYDELVAYLRSAR